MGLKALIDAIVEELIEPIVEFVNKVMEAEETQERGPTSSDPTLRVGPPESLPPVAGEGFWEISVAAAMRAHTAVTGQ